PFLTAHPRTLSKAHSHAPEPDSRDFQIAFSEFAFFHCSSLRIRFLMHWAQVRCASVTAEAAGSSPVVPAIPSKPFRNDWLIQLKPTTQRTKPTELFLSSQRRPDHPAREIAPPKNPWDGPPPHTGST